MAFIFFCIGLFLLSATAQTDEDRRNLQNELFGRVERHLSRIDRSELSRINTGCFNGLELFGCKPNIPDVASSQANDLEYYYKLSGTIPWCAQCCGYNRHVDVWNMTCVIEATQVFRLNNLYDYEFRMGTHSFDGDRDYVICPIKRHGCTYSNPSGGNQWADWSSDCSNATLIADRKYIHGYKMTIDVEERDSYFTRWRQIHSCSVEVYETEVPIKNGDKFQEMLVINHPPVGQYDAAKFFLLFLLLIVLVYPILWYCRREQCSVCAKKLVMSRERCWICRFFDAKPPDPVLVHALEEKGLHAQGVPHARYPLTWLFTKQKVRPTAESVAAHFDSSLNAENLTLSDLEGEDELEEQKAEVKIKKKGSNKNLEGGGQKAQRNSLGFINDNPNVMDIHSAIVYEAVEHPFPPDRPIGYPERPSMPEIDPKYKGIKPTFGWEKEKEEKGACILS